MNCHLFVFVCLAFAISASPVFSQPTPDALLVEIRAQLPQLATQEQNECINYKCDVMTNSKTDTTVKVRRGAGGGLLLEERNKLRRAILNDDYMFGIEKNKKAGSWSLLFFSRSDRLKVFNGNVSVLRHVLFPLTAIGTKDTLETRINNVNFRFTATRVRSDGGVDAEFATEELINGTKASFTGKMSLAPDNKALVLKYYHDINIKVPIRFTLVREMDKNVPTRCNSLSFTITNTSSGAVMQRQQANYGDYSTESVKPEEFRLEYYGIPVPADDVSPQRSKWWIWVLLGTACVVVALVARRRSRRQ